ncbi:MAG TPA: M48 family metallopeptidase [Cryptosporangiaceae bacterium]|nr:M48 family metallopeptidase [Cryptosporangiaceae bacterium]
MDAPERGNRLVRDGLVAVALLLGVYVLVLLMVAIAVAAGLWALANIDGHALGKVLGFAGMVVLVMLVSMLRSLRRRRVEPSGIELTPSEQPRLWATVRHLASAVDTRPPDEIRLDADLNASVVEESRWLGLLGGKRTMHIGAPVLLGLSVAEVYAVLGHELGHYSGRHSTFARISVRGAVALTNIIDNMDYAVVRGVFAAYAKLYFAVSAGIRREHERAADRVAVAVTGRRQTLSALQRMARLGPAWDLATEVYGPLAKAAGRTPDLFAAFAALQAEPGRAAEYDRALATAMAEPTDRYDTHPALRDRLAAAAAQPDTSVRWDDAPALTLIAYPPQTLDRLQADVLQPDLGPRADWPELVERGARQQAATAAGELVRVAAPHARPLSLRQVLDGVAAGYGASMVRALVNPALAPEDLPAASREVLTEMLVECVTSALIEAGVARARVNWAGPHPWELTGADGAVLDVGSLVAPAIAPAMPDTGRGDPRGVAWLRDRLIGMGVPVDRPIRPAEHDPLAPDLVAVLFNVKLDRKCGDVLVCDTGLLFVKQSRLVIPKPAQLSLSQRGFNRKRLARILERPLAQVGAAKGNRFIGTHDIIAARTKHRLTSFRVALQLTDGSSALLRSTAETEELGEAWEAAFQLLGARMQPA